MASTVNFFGSSLQKPDLPKYQWNRVLLDLAEAATVFSKEIQGGSAFADLLRDMAATGAFSDAVAAMQSALAFARRARKIVFSNDREKEIFSSFSKLAGKAVQKSWSRPAATPSAVDHASNPHEGGSGGTGEEEGVEPVAAVVESPEPEVQVTRPMDRFPSSIPPVGSATDSAFSHRQRQLLPTDDSDSASHEVQAAFDEVKDQLAGSAAEMSRTAAQRVSSDSTRGARAASGKGGAPQTSALQGISGSSRLVGAAKRSARGTGALYESFGTTGASTSPPKSGRHSVPPATHVPATSGGSAASVGFAVGFDDAVEPFDDVIYSDMSPHDDAINYHGSRRDAVGVSSDAGFERLAPDADLERRSVDAELSEDLGLQGLLDAARDEFDEIGDVSGRAEPHRQEARGRPRPTTRVPLASPEPGDATPMRVDSRLTPRVQSAPARESRVSFVEADDDDEVGGVGVTAVRGGDSIDAILGGVNSADARSPWERRLLEAFDGVSSAGLPAGLAAAVRDEFEQLDLNRVVPERDRSLLAIRKLFTQPAAAICRLLSVVPVDALKSKHSKLLHDSESKRDLLFSLLVNKVLVDVDDETLDDWFEGDSNASARFVRLWATAPIRILAEDLRNLTYERSLLSVKAQQSRNILHQLRDERSVLHDRHFVDSLRTADRLARVTAGATASTADSSTSRARDRDGSDSSDSESSRGRRGRSRSRARSRRDFRPRSGSGGGGSGGARQQVRTQDRGRGRGDWRSRSPRAREQSRGRGAGGYSKEGGQRFQAGGAGEVKYAGGSSAQRQQQGNYKGPARHSRG